MDRIDRKILELLQRDWDTQGPELAKAVGISKTPCRRRVQKLQDDGIIQAKVTLLDPVKVNVGINVFVSVQVKAHSIEWQRRFSEVVAGFPEVLEVYRMSGVTDYLVRVVVPDVPAYDAFHQRFASKIELGRAQTRTLPCKKLNTRRSSRSSIWRSPTRMLLKGRKIS